MQTTQLTIQKFETEIMDLAEVKTSESVFTQSTESDEIVVDASDYANLTIGDIITFNSEEVQMITKTDPDTITLEKIVDWTAGGSFDYQTWNEKIDIAQRLFVIEVESKLLDINSDSDDEIDFEDITQSDAVGMATDYLTLHLIFEDLSINSNSDTYSTKSDLYKSRYDFMLQKALARIEVDIDGDTETYNVAQPKYSR